MTVHANASLAQIEVGGRVYPVMTERRCLVCQSPADIRLQIEKETVSGRSWSAISAGLPSHVDLSPRNVRAHFVNGHVPVEEATVQQHLHAKAEQRGEVVEQAVEIAADYLGFCEAVVGRVRKRVATGEVEPTVRDGIAAATVLARFDPGPQTAEQDYVEAFLVYHETVIDLLPPERLTDLSRRLDKDPVLKTLAARWDAAHQTAHPPAPRPSLA